MRAKGKYNLLFPIAVLLLLLAGLALTGRESSAWFSTRRSLGTPSEIAMPAVLDIRGKDYSEIAYMSLSELNTAGGEGSVQFLFCICGEVQPHYVLELAHTTNVPFRYQIFPARETAASPGEGWLEYTAEETVGSYYYNPNSAITMNYLNLDSEAPEAEPAALGAGNYYYGKVYSAADTAHSAAVPLFMHSDIRNAALDENGQFTDYYVIQISWDESIKNKEVDMVYLMAQVSYE